MAGLPFLTNQLGSGGTLLVEIAWGANLAIDSSGWTWTDVTADVRRVNGQGITISPIARSDEFSQAQPAGCAFELKNQNGAYTPFSPTAANYPNIRKNTPIRVRVALNGVTFTTRFFGYANGFTPGWDAEGRAAYVAVSASGTLRRIQQGNTPLRSPLTRWHLKFGPAGLWPLDDGTEATAGGSLAATGALMAVSGTATFGQTSTLAGTGAVVAVNSGTTLAAAIKGVTGTGFIAFDFWVKMFTTSPTNTQTYIATLDANGGVPGARVVAINASPGPPGFQVAFNDLTGGLWTLDSGVGSPGSPVNPYDGAWHNVFFTMTQSGSNVNTVLYVDGAQADSRTITSFTLGAPKAGYVLNGIFLGDTGAIDFAGLAIHTNSSATSSYSAGLGFANESATTRLGRLMTEEGGSGMPLSSSGSGAALMGPQGADTFINLLRECESTDIGILFDGLSQGFNYVTRSALYNQSAALTIDANSGQVPTSPAFSPVDDDQRIRNFWVASRSGGTSATYPDTTGTLGTNAVGTYDSQTTVNPSEDPALRNIASWLVHLGTAEGFRYPTLYLDLAGAPELATAWLATTPGERIDVTNLSNRLTQHPIGTVSLILEGYTEFLNSKQWKVTANCSLYRPWEVFTIQDTRLGRIETDGSALSAGVSSAAASLTVFGTTGSVWDTSSTPFDIEIEGEQITVGTVASAVTDAFGRTTSNGWGNADSGQAYTSAGGSASDHAVSSGLGRHTNASVNVKRFDTIDLNSTNGRVYADCGALIGSATGASLQQWLVGRMLDTSNFYGAHLDVDTSGNVLLRIAKVVAGTATDIAGPVTIDTGHSSVDSYRVGFDYQGSTLQAKAWFLPGTEPVAWNLSVTDTALTTGTLTGAMSWLSTGNTNASPVTTFDNLSVANPQTFTVTRSVNGVVKAHTAGAVVKLWKPGVLAL